MLVDTRVLELLSSRLCHDLISPVSAVNNGVELINDIGNSVVDEAMKLIGDSAQVTARRLRLFRLAYGRAGSEAGLAISSVRQTVLVYAEGSRVAMTWPDNAPDEAFAAHRGALKALVNATLFAEELLPYGGTLEITASQGTESTATPMCRIILSGRRGPSLSPFTEALDGSLPVDDLTPRTIQPYVTGLFARAFGLDVVLRPVEPERVDLVLTVLPAASGEALPA